MGHRKRDRWLERRKRRQGRERVWWGGRRRDGRSWGGLVYVPTSVEKEAHELGMLGPFAGKAVLMYGSCQRSSQAL
jgi:hypothetical protein